jgi:hypothetical protein
VRTEQLIQVIAADTERSRPVEALLPGALGIAAALAGFAYLSGIGVRPDLAAALGEIPVMVKHALPWLAAAGGFGVALRLSRPGARVGGWVLLLAGVAAVLGGAIAAEMVRLDPATWWPAVKGRNLVACLLSIPLMSVPIAGAALWVARNGASTRPSLTGAAIGLTSGSLAAGLYAFHCDDDSPLFYGVWYVVAVLAVALACALIGRRVLRW